MPQHALDWLPLLVSDVTTNSSNKLFTVPAGRVWEIQSIYVALTTNATVGNRNVAVDVQLPAGTVVHRTTVGIVQAASVTRQYNIAPYVANLTSFINTSFISTPMPPLQLPQNSVIRVYDIAAIDAAGTAENLLAYLMIRQYGQ